MTEFRQRAILVSACLLGLDTRYNGVCKKNGAIIDLLSQSGLAIIPVCPEQLAGLPTPRPKTEFNQGDGLAVLQGNGQITNSHNQTMNEIFLHGARQTLTIAEVNRCKLALLKERSPSCGVREVYRQQTIVAGQGVTTALLTQHGITVVSEETPDLQTLLGIANKQG